ncbi:MAG: four helix bundle protein [Muribaculaceae bacterium]|nr:four helix bundle protein [Muribaculaceae bacterium]
MEQFTFEKLEAWQKSRVLVKDVYGVISKFPQTEKFGLSSQLGRAIVSVPSNIAEGCGRPSLKERIHFFEIAYGSLMESLTQLIIASDLDFISEQEVEEVRAKIIEVARIISGLRKSLLKRIDSTK